MTPEQAKELLDAATPGPWEHDGYGSIGNYESRQIVAVSGPDMKDDPQVVADRNAIIATPDALATVAGLRYQYAAQVRRGTASPWLYVLQSGHFSKRGSTSVWCKKQRGCENAIRSALNRKDVGADTVEFRIVRRLVSNPEVME